MGDNNQQQTISSNIFTFNEIAKWESDKRVSLPTIQRGFVWKPFQIENLWDSILRGYPLGAFVLTTKNGITELLDGQQRATAICLGYNESTFRNSQQHFKVFIDLVEPAVDDTRKFIIRVVTRSHPWGYSKLDNSKILSKAAIRAALDLYSADDPLKSDLNEFFPADASLPVPLHLFIDGVNKGLSDYEMTQTIKEWVHWEKIYGTWEAKGNEIEMVRIESMIARIYGKVKPLLNVKKIPALYLDLSDYEEHDDPKENEAASEIETMFVRLNAGGTPLTGEELNYSILKAHISFDTQLKLEEACKFMFRPARFITIVYRLYQHGQKESTHTEALSMRIKPKQFQKTILDKNEIKSFEKFLRDLVINKNYQDKTLLEYVQEIVSYEDKQKYGLPFLLYSKISEVAPELIFMLLYRIKYKQDVFKSNDDVHKRMLGMICLMMWFGKGSNNKDHSKLLNNIWPTIDYPQELFWSSLIIQRAKIEKTLLDFPSLNGQHGLNSILHYRINEKLNIAEMFSKRDNNSVFLQRILMNKDLLMFAQREFLENFFKTEQHMLDDSSPPFDWDHLSANSFISPRNIPLAVHNCYQTIGNFRAWPYALNRMDSDNSPAKKFRPFDEKLHLDKNRLIREKVKWQNFVKKNNNMIQNFSELESKLLNWSFCSSQWAKFNVVRMADSWREAVRLIKERNVRLIEEWYIQHQVETLTPCDYIDFSCVLNSGKWKLMEKNVIESIFDISEDDNWLTSATNLNGSKIRLYFYYKKSENTFNVLKTNAVKFGIYNPQGLIISQAAKSGDFNKGDCYLETSYTLLTKSLESYQGLSLAIQNWIVELKFPFEIENQLIVKFKKSMPINESMDLKGFLRLKKIQK